MLNIVDILKKEERLTEKEGKYAGYLVCTYGSGVVFNNIKRQDFKNKYPRALTEKFIIYDDDLKKIEAGSDYLGIEKRIMDMFPQKFNFRLEDDQIELMKEIIGGMYQNVDVENKKEKHVVDRLEKKDHIQSTTQYMGKYIVTILMGITLIVLLITLIHHHKSSTINTFDMNELEVSEYQENQVVSIECKVEEIIEYTTGSYVLKIVSDSTLDEVYIGAETGIEKQSIQVGNTYIIKGVIKEYKGRLQIHPETTGDITNMSEDQEVVQQNLVGNKSSMKVHKEECEWVIKIDEDNKVIFETKESAVDQGYVSCKVCNP